MTILKIRGQSVLIDVESELREYDFGYNARWTSDKLVASSPFRTDKSPSFFVNLTGEYAGTWKDSGAMDDQFASGNIITLIAYMRGTDYGEACDYLLEKYGIMYDKKDGQQVRLTPIKINDKRTNRKKITTIMSAISPYLVRRGICPRIQWNYGIGYNPNHKGYTAIPWHYADSGEVATVKYRSTRGKRFFYEKGATPVRKLVYGLDEVNRHGDDWAVLVEGEIDVLSWATVGMPAIAVGGAYLSREQADLIKRSSIRVLLLGGDNDEQGRQLNEMAKDMLGGFVEIYEVDYGYYEDANDALMRGSPNILANIFENAKRIDALRVKKARIIP